MERLLWDYVGRNSEVRYNLIINGHSQFLLVTLVCSTSTMKTVFYVDAACPNDHKLTSTMNQIVCTFLEQFGIIPTFHITDGLQFQPDDGRVVDLVHLSTAFFTMMRVDYVHTKKQILFFSRDVMATALTADRCK